MSSLILSDLSQMLQLRRDTVRVRGDLARATQELSSGKVSDLGKSVSGNFAPLVTIDKQLSSLTAYDTNADEAAVLADTAQLALERVRDAGEELGLELINLRSSDKLTLGGVFSDTSAAAFESVVSALNSRVAGRSVFAGAATDRSALASGADMLAELQTLVAGETTAAGVANVLDTWFGPGGGFETTGYLGSANSMSQIDIADGRRSGISVKADDAAIREQLKGLAMGALLDGSGITDSHEFENLAERAGNTLIGNQTRVLELQAAVGSSQAQIEDAKAQNGSERTALQMARNGIVAIDPYDVASELQNLEVQLQTIYTITGRLSGLSLTNYLR